MRIRFPSIIAAIIGITAGAATAQNYPNRPVRVVVPFGAGGIADITTRLIVDKVGERLGGERFFVDNLPGAGGVAAARAALMAPADGYTLILFANGTAIAVPLFKSLPYDPVRDFVPIAGLSSFDLTLTTNMQSPYITLGDFLKGARANPGKLNIGTINVGSSQNLGAELLRTMAGVDAAIIPYRSTPDIMVAVLRNDVQLMVEYYATTRSNIEDGKLRLLATTGVKRSPLTPDAPTATEAGIPGYEVESWNALFAKAGTPKEVIVRINEAVRAVVAIPEIRRRMSELGLEPKAGPPEEIGDQLKADVVKWTKVMADAHLPKL